MLSHFAVVRLWLCYPILLSLVKVMLSHFAVVMVMLSHFAVVRLRFSYPILLSSG